MSLDLSEPFCKIVPRENMPPKETSKDSDSGGVLIRAGQGRMPRKDKQPPQGEASGSKKKEPKGREKEEPEIVSY